jgi:hypothetical protein
MPINHMMDWVFCNMNFFLFVLVAGTSKIEVTLFYLMTIINVKLCVIIINLLNIIKISLFWFGFWYRF